ncbi:hypothetical protein RhiXN_08172 [Rhizoctonia solani]|uniref:Uncharacterized protein n=1 Tax=Rhizoctonia solani TaxID=456999 RepID=A0A8H8P398_9AGAM|nr:uncharacterized protein RhiXN_08172 [Rhizoctonia solani]QRW23136.1 hypothetical protein RhiXN_08172 [Rhizoctonia solani]
MSADRSLIVVTVESRTPYKVIRNKVRVIKPPNTFATAATGNGSSLTGVTNAGAEEMIEPVAKEASSVSKVGKKKK